LIKYNTMLVEYSPIRLCKLSSLDDYVRIESTDESKVLEDEINAEYYLCINNEVK
jgi:hypothetical protein